MRKTKELIAEARESAKEFKEGAKVAAVFIVVGFESSTEFVDSDDAAAVGQLNALIKEGGEPVGTICCRSGDGHFQCGFKPFEEYKDEEWARSYLEHLSASFLKDMIASGKARPFNPDKN